MWAWYQAKQLNLKICVKLFLKCPLWYIAPKLENVGTKTFLQEVDKNCVDKIGFCQTLILPLWVVTSPCFPVKIGHREERGEEIKPWFWYISIAQQVKCFRTSSYFFHFGYLQGKAGGQSWTKNAQLWSVPFP